LVFPTRFRVGRARSRRICGCAVPEGLGSFIHAHPPLKRWAIFFRPASRDWGNRQCKDRHNLRNSYRIHSRG